MTWNPDPAGFVRDLEAKPEALRALGAVLDANPWGAIDLDARRVVFVGMGSSRFAALAAASRLRAHGFDAVAEYASAASHPGGAGTLAVGISAGGSTPETVEALRRHRDAGSRTVALTNGEDGPLAQVANHHLALLAGEEAGGVACRSYQHTLAMLLSLVDAIEGSSLGARAVRRAADATQDLLTRRDRWLPAAVELVGADRRAYLLAPNERISSAEQGALMLREGPRIDADACETGDWLHVDVYLTKPLDYRAVLFAGSRFDRDVLRWVVERDASLLAVGRDVDGARQVVRYAGDDDDDVALLAEVIVPELIAADLWQRGAVASADD